jgi:hypothetical protein
MVLLVAQVQLGLLVLLGLPVDLLGPLVRQELLGLLADHLAPLGLRALLEL